MFYNSGFEYNDCVFKGACSVSPNISSMQEVMLILLRQIAYYLLKLEEFQIKKEDVILDLITEITTIDSVKDFSEAQILNSFSKQYNNLVKIRKEYLKQCKLLNIDCEDLKNIIKLSPKTNLSNILQKGDKEFLQKYKRLNFNNKYYEEILLSVIKSVSVNLISLNELKISYGKAVKELLKGLNIFNSNKVTPEKVKSSLKTLAQCDIELFEIIYNALNEHYGTIQETVVSTSTRRNKAILVSGSNLEDLKALLEYTKDIEIDIYTNGNLLIAHAFPYFKNFKNLRGHFGTGTITTILDFATFPGAILLTKNETQNIEYLYRGRLFTTDNIPPKGVAKIENYDFGALLDSALNAKGFAKGQERETITIGFDEGRLEEQINEIYLKNPKNLYIVGASNLSIMQKDYFKKFFAQMDKDSYAITFSYNPEKTNVLSIDICKNYALLYFVLQKLFEKFSITSDNIAFFMTKCDINSLSNIINLKNRGAKHIYLSDCSPIVINPAVLRAFNQIYEINPITNPKDDLLK